MYPHHLSFNLFLLYRSVVQWPTIYLRLHEVLGIRFFFDFFPEKKIRLHISNIGPIQFNKNSLDVLWRFEDFSEISRIFKYIFEIIQQIKRSFEPKQKFSREIFSNFYFWNWRLFKFIQTVDLLMYKTVVAFTSSFQRDTFASRRCKCCTITGTKRHICLRRKPSG